MPKSLLLITGIFPPDSGGPAKFSREFGIWAANSNIGVEVQTYAEEPMRSCNSHQLNVTAISRENHLLLRYFKLILSIGRGVKEKTGVLAVGAFLETYFSSLIFRFPYVVKVPGDIVWERARNNRITTSDIERFQSEKLTLKYRIFRSLYTASLKRSCRVIVPSGGLYKLCLQWGVPVEKLVLIYNSVSTEKVSGLQNNIPKYDLVTVCRLAPWKGVDELVAYAAKNNVSLLVVGDGPEREKLESLAVELKAQVTFAGEVAGGDVQQLLSLGKVFVLNSYYEGLPHALVEARIAGLLSVARAETGSAEVINDDVDGFLIRKDRPLEKTLDLALGTYPNSSEMTTKAKQDCTQRFSKQTNYPLILEVVMGSSE